MHQPDGVPRSPEDRHLGSDGPDSPSGSGPSPTRMQASRCLRWPSRWRFSVSSWAASSFGRISS